jgi:hypothetical protein
MGPIIITMFVTIIVSATLETYAPQTNFLNVFKLAEHILPSIMKMMNFKSDFSPALLCHL